MQRDRETERERIKWKEILKCSVQISPRPTLFIPGLFRWKYYFLISIFCKQPQQQQQQQLFKAGCKLNTVVTDPLNSVILYFPLTAGNILAEYNTYIYIYTHTHTYIGRSCRVLPCAFRLPSRLYNPLSFTNAFVSVLTFLFSFHTFILFLFFFFLQFLSYIYFFQVRFSLFSLLFNVFISQFFCYFFFHLFNFVIFFFETE